MTTKFLDNQICTFKILLAWRFPRKTTFLDKFPLCPESPPPQKRKFYFYCRLAVSEFKESGFQEMLAISFLSFYRRASRFLRCFRQVWRISILFLPVSHTHGVAHLFILGVTWFS